MLDFFNNFTWGTEDSVDSVLKKANIRKIKLSSLSDLDGFIRLSTSTLVSKAEKDFWEIEEDEDGEMIIYRLFDSADGPLKD